MPTSGFVEVAFPVPLDKTFHYEAAWEQEPVGRRVLAPFGRTQLLTGVVVATTLQKPSFPTKPIREFLQEPRFVDPTLMTLTRWVADRYLCSWGEALACVVPASLQAPRRPKSEEGREKRDVYAPPSSLLTLTTEQASVLDPILAAIDRRAFTPFLLHGITDSGKTEVYLRAIEKTLAGGRQALYLLPEIALTPPFAQQLVERFGAAAVAIWHSGMSAGERFRVWCGLSGGSIRVLLGARSAVFAPFRELGLVVMDEEHEPAYKQEDRPRYHARDVVRRRAELTSATLILGSATPSLEAYFAAQCGSYRLLEMRSRVEERQLPQVEIIDRRPPSVKDSAPASRRPRLSAFAVFSEPLRLAIEQRLARREQILLFVNRRGYTPFLRCSHCGWVARCSRCSTALTMHLREQTSDVRRPTSDVGRRTSDGRMLPPVPIATHLQCHSCGKSEVSPVYCPGCQGLRLRPFGIGTQRVEQEIRHLFPFAKLARLDRDAAKTRTAHEKLYRDVLDHRVDVLIGTQMIAKGFDFPNVTLVGVVDADVSLHLPDFRSAERTFQLLEQVAGRTGRGDRPGTVLVQTHVPDHPALQHARTHDYAGFYDEELQARADFGYPPHRALTLILLRGAKEPAVRDAAETLVRRLEELLKDAGVEWLGPAPAPYAQIRRQFRYQVFLKGDAQAMQKAVLLLRGLREKGVFITVDVDPVDLL